MFTCYGFLFPDTSVVDTGNRWERTSDGFLFHDTRKLRKKSRVCRTALAGERISRPCCASDSATHFPEGREPALEADNHRQASMITPGKRQPELSSPEISEHRLPRKTSMVSTSVSRRIVPSALKETLSIDG